LALTYGLITLFPHFGLGHNVKLKGKARNANPVVKFVLLCIPHTWPYGHTKA